MEIDRGGRPTALTPTTQKKILAAIRKGLPLKFAAESVGLSESTVKGWARKGRRSGEEPYLTFLTELKKARAAAVMGRIKLIDKAGKKTWQAAAWMLERLHPDYFSNDRREIREIQRAQKELDERIDRMEGNRPRINADADTKT